MSRAPRRWIIGSPWPGYPTAIPYEPAHLGMAFDFTPGLPGYLPGIFGTFMQDGRQTYQGGPGCRYMLEPTEDDAPRRDSDTLALSGVPDGDGVNGGAFPLLPAALAGLIPETGIAWSDGPGLLALLVLGSLLVLAVAGVVDAWRAARGGR